MYAISIRSGAEAKAYEYAVKLEAVKDSLALYSESRRVADLSVEFETLQKEREIDLLKGKTHINELSLQSQKNQVRLMVVVVALVVLIMLIAVWRHRLMRRRRIEVEAKNSELEKVNNALREKIGEIRTLGGLLPICSSCKKIRNDNGFWEQVEGFLEEKSDATFSESICPECAETMRTQTKMNSAEI